MAVTTTPFRARISSSMRRRCLRLGSQCRAGTYDLPQPSFSNRPDHCPPPMVHCGTDFRLARLLGDKRQCAVLAHTGCNDMCGCKALGFQRRFGLR